jgi:heat shock protein HtpX
LSNTGYSAWLNIIMLPYVDIFLHITLGISRYQEYAADKLAARITSVSSTCAALRMVYATDDIFDAYWQSNIKPLVDAGFIPPITEGINRFMSSNLLSGAIKRKAEQKVEESKVNRFAEYSTHPRLAQRIEALADISNEMFVNEDNEIRATSLVGDISQLERKIFAKYIGEAKVDSLKSVAWENICSEVYFPMWRQTVRRYSAGLADVTPEMLPDIARNMSDFSVRLIEKSEKQIDSNRGVGQAKSASATLGAATTLALHNAGWAVNAAPGQPTSARRDGEEIRPFEILGRLVSGNLSGEEWRQCCHSAGIAGVNFGNLLSQSKSTSTAQ